MRKLLYSLILTYLFFPGYAQSSCQVTTGFNSNVSVDENSIDVQLSWDAVSIGEQYQVSYYASGITSTTTPLTTEPAIIMENLAANKTYYWRVRVLCNGQWSPWPTAYQSFTTPDGPSCFVESGFNANVVVSANSIDAQLSWNAVSIGEQYQVSYYADGISSTTLPIVSESATIIGSLIENKTYYWRVRVQCNGQWSAWPTVYQYFTTPDGPSCFVESGFNANVAVNGNSIQAQLSWDAVSIGEQYQVNYYADGMGATSLPITTAPTTVLENLVANKTYYWRVRVQCNGQWPPWPLVYQSFTTPDGASCLVQSGFNSNVVINENSINAQLNWDAVSIGEQYQVNYYADGIAATTLPIISESTTMIGNLIANKTYYWRVRVMCNGQWPPWPTVYQSFTTPDGPSCFVGSDLNSNVSVDGNSIDAQLSWGALNIGEQYQVSYYADGISSTTLPVISEPAAAIVNLAANKTYHWRVRAQCNGQWSPWPTVYQSFTTPDGPSCFVENGFNSNVVVNANNASSIDARLSWNPSSIAEQYQVSYYANEVNSTSLPITTTPSAVISNLLPNKTYYWRVRLLCNGQWSPWPSTYQTFDSKMFVQGAVSGVSNSTATDGNINLNVIGGTPPYTYNWSTGEATANIFNKGIGTYTVSVNDAGSSTVSRTFNIGRKVIWADLSGVSEDNGILTKTAPIGWNNSGAMASNILPSNEDGWLEFVAGTNSSYVIGLSITNGLNSSDFEHGVYIYKATGLFYAMESSTLTAIALWQPGDIFRISREGTSVKYYRNGEVFRTISVNPALELRIKASVYEGSTPSITTSLESKLMLRGIVSGVNSPAGTTGGITLNVAGGTPPYTYSWSSGETTASISDKGIGSYSVTVTDAAGRTESKTYNIGYEIFWTNLNGVSESNTILTRTAPGTSWNAGADASNILPSNEDGWIEFVAGEQSVYAIGFSVIDQAFNQYVFQNAIDINDQTGLFYVFEGGTFTTISNFHKGDVFRISREGASVKYYRNGVVFRTTTIDPALELKPKSLVFSESTPIVATSFDSKLIVHGTVSSVGALSEATGVIILNVVGGTLPYTYSWSSGETTANISGKGIGNYTVTVTDAAGRMANKTYSIGYKTYWTNLNGVSESNTILTRTASGTNWDAGADGSNLLTANEDGWIEFVASDEGVYAIGFSVIDRTFNQQVFQNGIDVNAQTGLFYVFEGTTITALSNWHKGDIFRISREGVSVKYYRNGVVFRTTTIDPALELKPKSVVFSGSTPIVTTSFDSKLIIHATVSGVGSLSETTGSITLSVAGGASPYTYSWSTGETAANISGKGIGAYTVTVTDAKGRTASKTYGIGYKTYWRNLTGVSENNTILTRTAAGTEWNAGANSINVLPANMDGWIEIVANGNNTYIVGFSLNDGSFNAHDFRNGIDINNHTSGRFYAFEGSTITTLGNWLSGDVFRISREGGSIKYYRNGIVFRTVLTDPALELRMKASIYGGSTPYINTSFGIPAGQGLIPDEIEFAALKEIYDSLGGPNWTNKTNWPTPGNWPASVTSAEFGTWYGITVENGDITKINLAGNNLIGKIPGVSMQTLASLSELQLSNNRISGSIPSTLGGIANLKSISLGANSLTGTIPSDLSLLVNLEVLDLNTNNLTGSMPDMGTLVNLKHLGLHRNQTLTPDPIPAWIQNLTNLTYLNLEHTKRTGSIPSFLGNLVQLKTLGLHNNQLSGPIPAELGNLNNLEAFILHNNQLTGSIPANLGNLKKLISFILNNNQLSGTLPSALTGMSSVVYFNVAHNNLTGTFPETMTAMTAVTHVYANNNQFSGTLPAVLSHMNKVWYLDLSNNQFSGVIPPDFGASAKLSFINFENNQLSGTLPVEFTNMPFLTDLKLSNNELTGIPDFSSSPYRQNYKISVDNNFISFATLEPNFSTPGVHIFNSFTYSPQKPIPQDNLQLFVRDPLLITPVVSPTASTTIQWEKQQSDQSWLNINSLNEDVTQQTFFINTSEPLNQGVYRWIMTSTVIPGLTIQSTPIQVQMFYATHWTDLSGVVNNSGTLTKTNPTNAWNAGAIASNALAPDTDGWIEFTVQSERNFAVGFGANTPLTYNSFENAIRIGGDGNITTLEKASATPNENVQPGDVLRIEREGSEVKYSRNGTVFRTVTVDSTLELWPRAMIYTSGDRIPHVLASMDSRLMLHPAITSAGGTALSGGIALAIAGGNEPYAYQWSTGEQTSSVGDKGTGTYTVTVTDAVDRTQNRSLNIGYKVGWIDGSHVNDSEGRLAKTSASGWNNAGANSSNTLPPDTDGWVEVTADTSNSIYYIGFVTGNPEFTESGFTNSLLVNLNDFSFTAYANTTATPARFVRAGDVFRIAREGSEIKYYHNGIIVRTVSTDPALELKIRTLIHTGHVTSVTASFDSEIVLNASITGTGFSDGTGKISVTAAGGLAPYTFNWASGEQADSVVNKNRNTYTVTVTDAEGRSKTRVYSIGYKSYWTDFTGVTENNGTLTASGTTPGGANASNVLAANTNGWVEFVAGTPGNTYTIGLAVHAPGSFNQTFTHAIHIDDYTGLYAAHDSTAITPLGSWHTGDVFRISREGSEVKYYRNDSLVHTVVTDSTAFMTTRAVVSQGAAPRVNSSFDTQLNVQANVTPADASNRNGRIALNVTGGAAPYTYQWTSGDQTATIIDKARNTYIAQVTDAEGRKRTITYTIGHGVSWTNLTGVSNSSGVLTKASAQGGWGSGAIGSNVLEANTDGWIEFVAGSYGQYITGFATNASQFNDTTFRYALYLNDVSIASKGAGTFYVREGTTSPLTPSYWFPGDVFRIAREGNEVKYYHNGIVIRTVAASVGEELKVKTAIFKGSSPKLNTSLDSKLILHALVYGTGGKGYPGSISLAVSGGRAPYTYSWSTGEGSSGISDKTHGSYAVTVTDADGRVESRIYTIGYKPYWASLTNVTKQDSTIIKTTASSAWDAGAMSTNLLPSNTDGWIEFVAGGNNTFEIGFAINAGLAETDFQSALTLHSESHQVYAHELSTDTLLGSWQEGDVLRISREGNAVKYYRNETVLRTVPVNAGLSLRLKTLVHTGKAPLINTTFDSRLFLITNVAGSSAEDSNGSLTVNVSGGQSPYVYSWDGGERTATLNNVAQGTYRVTVTDKEEREQNRMYSVGFPVSWSDVTGASDEGGIVTKTSATQGWGNAGAISFNALPADSSGWLEFVALENGSTYMIGLASDTSSFDSASFRHAIYVDANGLLTVYDGTTSTSFNNWLPGDVFRLAREGSEVKYYRNGNIMHTASATASAEMIVKAAILEGSTPAINTSFFLPTRQGKVPDIVELQVLKEIYESLGGTGWTDQTNWPALSAWPASVESDVYGTWYGVKVRNGDVVSLTLNSNNLTGNIPPSIGKLAALDTLNFSDNNIGGNIPSQVGTLRSLTQVLLHDNQLTGSIPSAIGNLNQLKELSLQGNTLGGPIPSSIGNLTQLSALLIHDNQLSGAIPASLGNLHQMTTFNAANNQLSGSLPVSIGNWGGMQQLSLQDNQLSGAIPAQIVNLQQLEYINLSNNEFNGSIPEQLALLPELNVIDLQNNEFSGAIPQQFASMPALSELILTNNNLTAVPDFSSSTYKQYYHVFVAYNRISFASLEPNFSAPNTHVLDTLVYAPQKEIIQDTLKLAFGDRMIIQPEGGGSRSTVIGWEKQQPDGTWADVTAQNEDIDQQTFTIDMVDPVHAGLYRWTMTDSLATALTLYSSPIPVIIEGLIPYDEYPADKIPPALVVSREGRPALPRVEQAIMLSELQRHDTLNVFPAPPCFEGRYYAGFQLYYDLGDQHTQTNWKARLAVTLLHGEEALWTKHLQVDMESQTFIATVFHDSLISCDGDYRFAIRYKDATIDAPEDNIYLNVLLFKNHDEIFSTAAPVLLNCNYSGSETLLSWTYEGNGAMAYDVEWVFIESHENFTGSAPQQAFMFKRPVRITTAALSYKHIVFYPTGRLWYRVRAVGYNPEYPDHRISGQWFYSPCSVINLTNPQPDKTWMRTTAFAEEGKNKNVVHYYDGTLRERQVQTNLSTEEVTLVGETYYDFEGRPSVNVLPVPATNATLTYKPGFNVFQAIDQTVAGNTSAIRKKFHYDNSRLDNSILANTTGAGKYYSPANGHATLHKDYIPDAEGYSYTQTEYSNDGTGKITRQSGVGPVFSMDSTHTTRYYYASAATEELVRLFGSNVGKASHYEKSMVVDANGQVSISYKDQEDRVIATALAGDNPANVDSLQSLKDLDVTPVTVNIISKNTKEGNVSQTSHKLLNVAPNTNYTFEYDLSAYASQLEEIGCQDCLFDLKITITDPEGKLMDLSSIPGNQSGGLAYERKGISASSCIDPAVVNDISFNVMLAEVGDYTITKTLTAHELTFEQMATMMKQRESVNIMMEQIRQEYVLDPARCAICTTCDVDTLIQEAMNEIAALDCDNIYNQIVQSYQKNDNSENLYEVPDSLIEEHPLYCKYLVCAKNKESDVFEKKLARVRDWPAAVAAGYENILDEDPFFNNSALSGYDYKDEMQDALEDVYIGTIGYDSNGDNVPDGTREYRGTLWHVTDPGHTAFYIDQYGMEDPVNGKHILYFDLMNRRPQMGETAYQEELNQMRWTLYRSFYLEAKRKIKLTITEYSECDSARKELELHGNLPTTEEEIIEWADSLGVYDVTDLDVEMAIASIEMECDTRLSQADSTSVANNLKQYFNSRRVSILKNILKTDLTTNSNLVSIQGVLNGYGCVLDSVAMDDPFLCARDTVVIIPKVVAPVLPQAQMQQQSQPQQLSPFNFSSTSSLAIENSSVTKRNVEHIRTVEDSLISAMQDSLMNAMMKKLEDELLAKAASDQKKATKNQRVKNNGRNGTLTVNQLSTPLPDPAEYNALMALYNSTGGLNWNNRTGWESADPNVVQPLTGWHGVQTNAEGHVTLLNLEGNNLTGSIPTEIGGLTYCFLFYLANNQLSGPIPSSIGNLANLHTLSLAKNSLSGFIPSELGTLTNLVVLDISNNNLSGSIPSELGNLINLNVLSMSRNSLSGPIPSSLGSLMNLISLDLYQAGSLGSIPEEFGNLQNLQIIDLRANNLTGSIPSSLGNLTNIRRMNLALNDLSGSIPESFGNFINLQELILSANNLTGSIPQSFGNLVNIRQLYLSSNNLTGPIPSSFINPNLSDVSISDNNFTFSHFLDLTHALPNSVTFYYNNQNAIDNVKTITSFAGQPLVLITNIDRSTTPLSKYQWFKQGVGGLTPLTPQPTTDGHTLIIPNASNANEGTYYYSITNDDAPQLTLWSNPQTVVIVPPPCDITTQFNALMALYAATDGENWSVRTGWENADPNTPQSVAGWHGVVTDENGMVTRLILNNNNLNGTIPAELGNLCKLEWLLLSNNKLQGAIPQELGNLAELNFLYLDHNELTEPLPHNLIAATDRTFELRVDWNKLTFSDLLYNAINGGWTSDCGEGSSPCFTYSPQDSVDVKLSHTLNEGETLTLTANIDRSTSPLSNFQWFKYVDGTTDTPINAVSTSGHTVVFNNISPAQGGYYYYRITNTSASNLSLVSRLHTVKVIAHVPMDTLSICFEYDTTNSTLKNFSYTVDWNEIAQQCMERAAKEDSILTEFTIEKLVEHEVSSFYRSFQTNCLAGVSESLTYTYASKEYHYTLYYYDQAGNLVQTVPPKGVKPFSPEQVDDFLGGAPLEPAHELVTKYHYNSLNQLIDQETPDAGESQFWYNNKGQLRISRNAQQALDSKYSYTRYDKLGRIIEVGEMPSNGSEPSPEQLNDLNFPAANEYVLTDVTRTHYDFQNQVIQEQFKQQHLRNRVSWVEVINTGSETDTLATYFSYDIHGNVKTLAQQIPDLALKRTDYLYDLVSGKVNYVMYQYGGQDQFIHRYAYDADNRITDVYTSSDGFIWNKEAGYQYYLHSPLARTELGEYRIQGQDYYYTLQGWIKGVNMPFSGDPGSDGIGSSRVGKDVFAYTLGYYEGDYKPVTTSVILSDHRDGLWTRLNETMPSSRAGEENNGLYNGNISWMTTHLAKTGEINNDPARSMQSMLYKYDQLHRIVLSRSLTVYDPSTGFAARNPIATGAAYDEDFSYDANGNILTLQRNDDQATLEDDFAYSYYDHTNRLKSIDPAMDTIYVYDAIGNLIEDRKEGVTISWTPYGKVRQVHKGDSITVTYRYDASGNRIEKAVAKSDSVVTTHYVRDASGNVMAIYSNTTLTEQPIYGSSRLGLYKGLVKTGHRTLGRKHYELSNHLGNILSVITDNVRMTSDSVWATVVSTSDYYPFGLEMKGRSWNDSTDYRYGFNGKEKDNMGDAVYDYGFRIYNPRIAKFLSVDPLTKEYPWYTPYQFAGNMPIVAIDLDGLEEVITINSPWFWNEKIFPTIVNAYQLLASDNIHDQRAGIMQLREAVGYAMRATDRPAGSHENRKLFVNDFAANYSPRTGDWGTITLQFRHTGLAIPIPESLLDKKIESLDLIMEARQFRNKALFTSFVAFGAAEALALDWGFLKGRMTTEFVTQLAAIYTLNDNNLTLAFDDIDYANVVISGFVSGKKLKVVSELLKSIADVDHKNGFDSGKLSEVNEILGEFGLRLFVNAGTKLPDKTPENVKFVLEIFKKIGRTKANEGLKESMGSNDNE